MKLDLTRCIVVDGIGLAPKHYLKPLSKTKTGKAIPSWLRVLDGGLCKKVINTEIS